MCSGGTPRTSRSPGQQALQPPGLRPRTSKLVRCPGASWHRRVWASPGVGVLDDPRVFDCPRCGLRVMVCRKCDRGQVYCGEACRSAARRESQRASARKYARTEAGRRGAARRQRDARHRRRTRESEPTVTHHGSETAPDAVKGEDTGPESRKPTPHEQPDHPHRCHFCGRTVSDFLRFDFLVRRFARWRR